MKVNITLILVIIILLLIGGGFLMKNHYEGQIAEVNREKRALILKNDTLQQISETQYRKLLADSLTQKELNRIVKDLEIKLEANPRIVYRTKIEIREVEKTTDSVSIENDTITVDSHYPQKENYFARYQSKISLKDSTATELWNFQPFDMALVVSLRDDGLYQVDSKVPSFMTISSIDVQGVPMSQDKDNKRNNFGLLLGGGVGQQFLDETTYYRLETGIRFKRFYIDVGFNTNVSGDAVIKFEF